ncbi:MAG: hypothetical protein ABSA40_05995 [Candidatus Dormibacteria bacterium]|jgi:hypothetical protein
MKPPDSSADRLFLILDPRSRRVVEICTGPGPDGRCPSFVADQAPPCVGFRVVPLRQTSANGLPFFVAYDEGDHCPLAWLDAGEAGEAPTETGAGTPPAVPPATPRPWA